MRGAARVEPALIRAHGGKRPPAPGTPEREQWERMVEGHSVRLGKARGVDAESARDGAQAAQGWLCRTWEDQWALRPHRQPARQREYAIKGGEKRRKKTAQRDRQWLSWARTWRYSATEIARREGVSPSTVIRAVRRIDPSFSFSIARANSFRKRGGVATPPNPPPVYSLSRLRTAGRGKPADNPPSEPPATQKTASRGGVESEASDRGGEEKPKIGQPPLPGGRDPCEWCGAAVSGGGRYCCRGCERTARKVAAAGTADGARDRGWL